MKKVLFATALAITALACNTTKRMVAGEEPLIYGKEWKLTTLNGNAIDTVKYKTIPTLLLDKKEQRVSGHAGCNRLMGGFKVSGVDNIKLSQLASTLMACPDMELEGNYMKALQEVDKFSVTSDNTLLLLKGSKVVARFVSK